MQHKYCVVSCYYICKYFLIDLRNDNSWEISATSKLLSNVGNLNNKDCSSDEILEVRMNHDAACPVLYAVAQPFKCVTLTQALIL